MVSHIILFGYKVFMESYYLRYASLILVLFVFTLIANSCSTESTPVYQLTTSSNPTEGGTVDEQIIQQKSTDYKHGTVVELTPRPSEGWKFVKWSGYIESSESVIQIPIKSDCNLKAFT